MNREAIYSVFWAKMLTVPGVVLASRRLKHWNDVPADQQPALLMSQTGESVTTRTPNPSITTMRIDVYIYVTESDTSLTPATKLNAMIDGVSNALAPEYAPSGRCTLGGLVTWARIEGQIETDEGTLGSQAVAIIPVVIEVEG